MVCASLRCEVSHSGRASKNDPALLVLAMCAGSKDLATRRAALAALPKVARIGTHLLHFTDFCKNFRGYGRAMKRALGNWYTSRPIDDLIMQVVKYRQRDDWTHRDVLRLSHPKVTDAQTRAVFQWVTHPDQNRQIEMPGLLAAAVDLMASTNAAEAVELIHEHGLPRECVPTDLLNESSVWEALLEDMPMTAMIRNLGKMSNIGLLKPMSVAATYVSERLANGEAIRKARAHPLAILEALKTYQQGHGNKGKLTWTAVSNVVDALDSAFYFSFKSVNPTGKRQLLALDVSGSMGSGTIAGSSLTPREGAAAMALVLANTEKNYHIVGYTSGARGWSGHYSDLDGVRPLEISPRQRLDTVVKYMSGLSFGGTDCALPMLYALKEKLDVDAFTSITDNESWDGAIHPTQALARYRAERHIPAKGIVVAMTATNYTVADPNDAGQLDCVGFDTAVPQIISDFIRN